MFNLPSPVLFRSSLFSLVFSQYCYEQDIYSDEVFCLESLILSSLKERAFPPCTSRLWNLVLMDLKFRDKGDRRDC